MKKIIYGQMGSDLIAGLLLAVISLFCVYVYFPAQVLHTGYLDWFVQAFRVQMLHDYGFLSWTHIWSNGISLWKTYQFIPHAITVIPMYVWNVDAARAMILVTISSFVLIRLFTYGALRILGFSPLTAFICALVTLSISQFWAGVSEYSLMFASVFFPIVLLLWVQFFRNKLSYIFPYITGLLFYIHPILGFSTGALMMLTMFINNSPLFSKKTLTQIILFAVASSLFWYPVLIHESFSYTALEYKTTEFLQLLIAPYRYVGLEIVVLSAFLISSGVLFLRLPRSLKWAKVLYLYSALFLIFMIVGLHTNLPQVIQQFQYVRGASILGIAIIFVFAVILERVVRFQSFFVKSMLFFMIGFVLAYGVWISSKYMPEPLITKEDPVAVFVSRHPEYKAKRIWTPTIDTSSYYAPSSVQYPYSYMPQLEPNQVPRRFWQTVVYHPSDTKIPEASLRTVDRYFKLSATDAMIFETSSPFVDSLRTSSDLQYQKVDEFKLEDTAYTVFTPNWRSQKALLIGGSSEQFKSHFPFDIEPGTVAGQRQLDMHTEKFVRALENPENQSLQISYPTQESLTVSIKKNTNSNTVYIAESYSNGWSAYLNNKKQEIFPVGPNYIGVSIPQGATGELQLIHDFPLSWYISVFLITGIPISAFLSISVLRLFRKQSVPSVQTTHQQHVAFATTL